LPVTAIQVRQRGSNSWLLTGWVKKNPDSSGAGYVAAGDTLAGPSHTRPGEGAGAESIIAPAADDGNGPAFSRGEPGEPDLAGDTRTKLARMQASEARHRADAGRAAASFMAVVAGCFAGCSQRTGSRRHGC
jgi:hypothetical protein